MIQPRVWCRCFVPKLRWITTDFASAMYSTNADDRSPLDGIRVLDLTRIIAGPYCTMILGDLGAEILKIEQPGAGDESRRWGPPFPGGTKYSTYFASVNRNKKSVTIDLKKGREIVYELAKKSDVLVENFVPGKLSKMGLGYNDLKRIAPHLIYCSITGFGYDGPYAKRPGYDVIAASLGGLMHLTGPKHGDPCKAGVTVTDISTGLFAHGAIMAALLQRMKTTKGQWIQCDLLSTQVASLINIGSNYLNTGEETTRLGSEHESVVPCEAYQTKDGYMTIAAGSDLQFLDLLKKIDLIELKDDEKYKTNNSRVENREELSKILRKKFKEKTNEEWNEILEGSSFPYGKVNTIKQVFEDPHIQNTQLVKQFSHPVTGQMRVVGPPVRYSFAENAVRLPPPTLGQHTTEVLQSILKYPNEIIQQLKSDKVI